MDGEHVVSPTVCFSKRLWMDYQVVRWCELQINMTQKVARELLQMRRGSFSTSLFCIFTTRPFKTPLSSFLHVLICTQLCLRHQGASLISPWSNTKTTDTATWKPYVSMDKQVAEWVTKSRRGHKAGKSLPRNLFSSSNSYSSLRPPTNTK